MAEEQIGMLSGQDPLPRSQQSCAGHPQAKLCPSQQAGQYPVPEGGYYPLQQADRYTQQDYILQQEQTFVVTAPEHQIMRTQPAPQDYMNRAICATLCCFWPTGICAIIQASNAREALARGDIASARASSESARKLTTISIIAGALSIVVVCIIAGVFLGTAVNRVQSI